MNNPHNRATRVTSAILASGSLLTIVVIAGPWVDEYLRLRADSRSVSELELERNQTRERNEQLDRVESELSDELEKLQSASIDRFKTDSVRESIVEIVRAAGARVRRLDIGDCESRTWAQHNDDVRSGSMPIYGEESDLELHTHIVSLQVDGSLSSVRQLLSTIINQDWLMTTSGLTISPTSVRESPVSLELQLVLYGLAPREYDEDEIEDFACNGDAPMRR